MKYISLLTILSCTLLANEDEGRLRNIENRLQSLECNQPCCLVNPPARPYPSECWGFFVNIDPIIWQAHVGGTGFAIETKNNTSFFNATGQSRVKNLNFDWDWGFRLGIGLNTTHDAWDFLVQWTRWCTDGRRNVSTEESEALYPRFGHPSVVGDAFAHQGLAKWEMNYNLLDFEWARSFWVSHCVSMRPFGGLRSAWINQKEYDAEFRDLVNSDFSSLEILQSDRFWGIGIRIGLDTSWEFGQGFGLFNRFAGNLLYSYHSVHHKEKGDGELLFDVGSFSHFGVAIFDLQIGVSYDWFSCDCCYHIGLDLGWELHWHPGQNQFLLFIDDNMPAKYVANQGDLGIQGFFLKVRFDF